MKHKKYILKIFICLILLNLSCTEEIALETESFESVLVVEATITNELKQHEVKLSRTYLLEDSEQTLENNAEVRVTDNTGNSFNFSQNSEGIYVSDIAFEAVSNVDYTLIINTADGKTYSSNQQTLTPISQIDNLYPEFVNDDTRGNGVKIFVDSENNSENAKYFRYEFEETYKVVTPLNYPIDVIFSNYFSAGGFCTSVFYDVEFITKTTEETTCYSFNNNTEIIQANSNNLLENNITRFPVRFIPEDLNEDVIDASILRDRYSIKVRQYVQNIESYNYYRILSLLGDSESVLSETQPGFLEGNLNGLSANSNRVIGFFEVASVTEQRIFFNYSDINIPLPNYIYACDEQVLNYNDNLNAFCDEDANERNLIYSYVTRENYKLTNYDEATDIYSLAKEECVNCTSVGSNIQPDFWID
ncbi:DUF4249 domain-containing protein [Lacinutrix chionoecetis]